MHAFVCRERHASVVAGAVIVNARLRTTFQLLGSHSKDHCSRFSAGLNPPATKVPNCIYNTLKSLENPGIVDCVGQFKCQV